MSVRARASVLQLDLGEVRSLLERIRDRVAPEDHACLVAMVQSLLELAAGGDAELDAAVRTLRTNP